MATSMLHQVISVAMLVKLEDPKLALAEKLSALDGASSWANCGSAHEATIGVHCTTDRVESNFGGIDFLMHVFRGIAVEHASGVVVENRSHHLAQRGDLVAHRKSKQQKGAPLSSIACR